MSCERIYGQGLDATYFVVLILYEKSLMKLVRASDFL